MTYTKIQWSLMGLLLVIEVIWVKFASFSFYYDKEILLYQVLFLLFLFLPYLFYKKFRPDPRIVSFLESILFLFTFIPIMGMLSYLAATLKFPFIDPYLVTIDKNFGIYTPSIVLFFRNHLDFGNLFVYTYNTYVIQFPFIIIYFSFFNKTIVLQRFLMQVMIAGLLTAFISAIFPAAGPYVWYGYVPNDTLASAMKQLYALRDNIMDISTGNGIVSLPSFHSIMGLLYTYTFRYEKKYIFIPILILNILMIFACIPIGEHYFADILGAFPVFLFAVWSEQLLFSYISLSFKRGELHRLDKKSEA